MPTTSSPIKRWRRAGTRTRIYLIGAALFVAAEIGGLSGVLPRPVALAVFAAGCLIAAATLRPADRRKP